MDTHGTPAKDIATRTATTKNVLLFGWVLGLSLVAAACVGATTEEASSTAPSSTAPEGQTQTTGTDTTLPVTSEPAIGEVELPDSPRPFQFNTDGVPTTLAEAPVLAELVAAGSLPPVEERLPSNPPVVVGYEEAIGKYGGNILTNLWDLPLWWVVSRQIAHADLVRQQGGNSGVFEPDLAERWETNADASEWTFFLREGLKWSDGEPFTTADIEFWYRHVLLNEELVSAAPAYLSPGGEVFELDVVDETTFRLTFAQPHPLLLLGVTEGSGMDVSVQFEDWSVQPAHYMTQFHPDFASEDELGARIDAAGVASWPELFRLETDPNTASEGRPYMWAWTPDGPIEPDGAWTWTRNPYYYKIDANGNQLPYIDSWSTKKVTDTETLLLNTIAGEFDLQTVFLRGDSVPAVKDAVDGGAPLQVIENLNGKTGEVSLFINHTTEDPVLREIFSDVRFRQAVSIAINREEVSEARFRGFSQPAQASFPPTDPLVYNEEWFTAFTDYDVDGANALLDEMGLIDRDEAGFRLRPDGDRLTIILDYRSGNHTQAIELIPGYMKDIGLDVQLKESTGALFIEVTTSNSVQWAAFSFQPSFYNTQTLIPGGAEASGAEIFRPFGVEWSRWYYSDGEQGEEPPADMLRVMELVDSSNQAGSIEERIELLTEVGELHMANLWVIGIAGMDLRPHIAHEDLRNITPAPYGLNADPSAHSQYTEVWFWDR